MLHAHAGLKIGANAPTKASERDTYTLTGSNRHVPFPTFPHTAESGTVTANVSHHEAKSASRPLDDKNLIHRTRLVASKMG